MDVSEGGAADDEEEEEEEEPAEEEEEEAAGAADVREGEALASLESLDIAAKVQWSGSVST